MLSLAIITIFSAGKLLVSSVSYSNPIPSNSASISTPSEEDTLPSQTIEMHVTYQGFIPEQLLVKKGAKITWIIWGDQVTGCTNAIVVPALGLRFKVGKGRNEIHFTAPSSKCW